MAKNNTAAANAVGGDGTASSAEDKLNTTTSVGGGLLSTTNPNDALLETRKAKMANLSFAQRRHELTRRIVQHTKSIAHCYALTAASLPKSHSSLQYQKLLKLSASSSPLLSPTSPSTAKVHDPPPRLGASVQVSSDALQFVKSGWISQDEAQDALYFHHDELWKARGHCHDVLGALCVLSTPNHNNNSGGGGFWPDFPTDVALSIDPFGVSKEKSYSPSELKARLASAIRRKLILGEVGASFEGEQKLTSQLPWRIVFEQGGGSIRLTYGSPRTVSTAEALRQRTVAEEEDETNLQQYPMEARLSVLSEDANASWKLLSLHVRCSPKTGESDHQLGMNKKQMFDLHRIGERAMIVEEAICRKANEAKKIDATATTTTATSGDENAMEIDGKKVIEESTLSPIIPRPLLRLFEVTHAFSLSLQLEMLSSQAEALRRGAWGGTARVSGVKETLGDGITVSPAYFFDTETNIDNAADKNNPAPIAVMAIHFWACDYRPRVGDIICSDEDATCNDKNDSSSIRSANPSQRRDDNYLPASDTKGKERLSLCIRAVPMVGLVVSLSGSSSENNMTTESHHLKRNADKLLSSIQNPFQLSMSDALLAATVLCAERRCHAVVDALNRTKASHLPPWIHLEVECGSITIAGCISYQHLSSNTRPPTVLFRLACDSRSGRFVPTFNRSISILRRLACNDPSTSDIQFVSNVAMASAQGARQAHGNSFAKKVGERESTGRLVRDAFDALSRSMDTLGRKCGLERVNESDVLSSKSLMEKSIEQSVDQTWASLITCSGIAAVFGLAGIALKITSGVDPMVDM